MCRVCKLRSLLQALTPSSVSANIVAANTDGRIALRESLLHDVNAKQRLHRGRWAATFAFRHVRRYQRHQLGPRHHPAHLIEVPNSRLVCFVGPMGSGNQARAKHVSG